MKKYNKITDDFEDYIEEDNTQQKKLIEQLNKAKIPHIINSKGLFIEDKDLTIAESEKTKLRATEK